MPPRNTDLRVCNQFQPVVNDIMDNGEPGLDIEGFELKGVMRQSRSKVEEGNKQDRGSSKKVSGQR